MKIFCLIIVILLLLLPTTSRAEVEINGGIEINNLLSLEKERNYLNYKNMNIFSLKAKASLSSEALAFGEFHLKNIGFPIVNSLSDLNKKSKVEPWALKLKEAYMEIYDFLFNNLDLKVGKQRISWGTADGMNPTDNLNPEDLEDPLDFKRKLGVNSLKLSYYLGPFAFIGVAIPIFTPSILPSHLIAMQETSQFPLPLGMTLNDITDKVFLPEQKPENSMGAIKIAWNVLSYDMSVSYFYGRDDIPIANRIDITSINVTAVDVNISMSYPKMHVIGYDLAGSIWDVGLWTELGCFIPEKIERNTYLNGILIQQETTLKDNPYFKYVIGSDYTFNAGFYINIQYIRGFFIERGDNLGDYIMAGIEKKFLNDSLKTSLRSAVEITDIDNPGFMPSPEISYLPNDNTEVIIGAIILEGEEGTTFGQFKSLDEMYLKFKYSF